MRRSRKAAPLVTGDAVAKHPAVAALESALPGSRKPQAIETLKVPNSNDNRAGVYRLVGPNVVAKHVGGSASTAERRFYENLAFSLGSAVPRLLAIVEEEDAHWLLLEDVIGERPDPEDPETKRQVSAVIAEIHGSSIPYDAQAALPDRGISHSVATSRRARSLLTSMPSEVDRDDRRMLSDLHDVLCRFEETASSCERALAAEPTTLVHCDVRPKNIIMGTNGRVTFVDWEFAGIGPPVVDYFAWDLEAYALASGRPLSTLADLDARSTVGRAMATVAWIEWSAERATLPWPERALRRLRIYLGDFQRDVRVVEDLTA